MTHLIPHQHARVFPVAQSGSGVVRAAAGPPGVACGLGESVVLICGTVASGAFRQPFGERHERREAGSIQAAHEQTRAAMPFFSSLSPESATGWY